MSPQEHSVGCDHVPASLTSTFLERGSQNRPWEAPRKGQGKKKELRDTELLLVEHLTPKTFEEDTARQ